jgi:hypothetical protein
VAIRIHAVTARRIQVLDEAETQRPTAILIALELGNGGLGGLGAVEADNSATARSSARLVLDLGLLDFADSSEQLDQIFVAGRPRQLDDSQHKCQRFQAFSDDERFGRR